LFVAISLLAAVLLSSFVPPPFSQAQETGAPPPPPTQAPLKRMRRVKGMPPKNPPSRRASANRAQASSDEDEEVVRVDTELVNILLTVIDENQRFVTTLRKEDLRILEDKVRQELSIFERETDLPLSLAILVDTSRSQEKVIPDERSAARAFIDAIVRPDRDNVAVISFTGEALLQQPLTNNLEQLRSAIGRVIVEIPFEDLRCEGNVSFERNPECYTGVWDAIWVTADEVLSQTPEQTRRAIILLSDGDDTGSRTKRQEAIDLAIKNNVVVYSIGIHDYELTDEESFLDEESLRKVSERTGGRAFFPSSERELKAAFAQIQAELRSQYLLAYQPANRKRDGSFRQVRIELLNPELRKQKLRLLYRQGYYARNEPLAAAPAKK
jgi:VWFA-related protein